MRTKWLVGLGVALTLAVAAYLAPGITGALAQGGGHSQMGKSATGDAPMAEMMSSHQKMVTRLKQYDEDLDTLVKRMDAASGQAKVDAEARLLSTLVLQHKTMLSQMMDMQGQMMHQMRGMEGMHAGAPSGAMHGGMMKQKSGSGQ